MIAYITELDDTCHDNFVSSNTLVLVDIKTDWCAPCRQLSPIIDKLSADFQGQLAVGKLDADSNSAIVEKLEIRSIPTLLLYKNGKVIERLTGMQTYQNLSDLIKKHLES